MNNITKEQYQKDFKNLGLESPKNMRLFLEELDKQLEEEDYNTEIWGSNEDDSIVGKVCKKLNLSYDKVMNTYTPEYENDGYYEDYGKL